MRRLALIGWVLALGGCNALRDTFAGRQQTVGTAAGQTLTVEHLAKLIGHASRIPVRPDVFTGLASVYLDYAVFATALGHGRDLHDSTLVLAAEWPLVSQIRWERYHEQLIATRGQLTTAQMDSAFTAGSMRLFQHILIRVPASALPMIEQQKQKEATSVLMQAAVQRGANFRQLVQKYSEDPGSKVRGGYLPASARGQWVAAFDSAAWTLPPGAMTGVVRSRRCGTRSASIWRTRAQTSSTRCTWTAWPATAASRLSRARRRGCVRQCPRSSPRGLTSVRSPRTAAAARSG